MHKVRTPWPVATRVQYIVAFEELRRQHPGLSARRFCEATDVPYPTFVRWWSVLASAREASPSRPPQTSTPLPYRPPRSRAGHHPPRSPTARPGRPPPPRLPHPGRPHLLQPQQRLPGAQASQCPRPPPAQAQAGMDPLRQGPPGEAGPDGPHVPAPRTLPTYSGG